MGSYAEWDEEKRIDFLTRELEGKRPLVPPAMPMTNDVREVRTSPPPVASSVQCTDLCSRESALFLDTKLAMHVSVVCLACLVLLGICCVAYAQVLTPAQSVISHPVGRLDWLLLQAVLPIHRTPAGHYDNASCTT